MTLRNTSDVVGVARRAVEYIQEQRAKRAFNILVRELERLEEIAAVWRLQKYAKEGKLTIRPFREPYWEIIVEGRNEAYLIHYNDERLVLAKRNGKFLEPFLGKLRAREPAYRDCEGSGCPH
ncbi:MAG: hypothetical protein F7C38_06815 [Desulfurococcales archaeon]|nr:hypothetical protein [Desulfurococcales archaeon]